MSRSYCFTINNPTDDDVASLRKLERTATYVVVGEEVGKNQTKHLQGYTRFKNATSFSSIKKKLPRAHIEVCKGNPQQNIKYCKKDGKIIYEYGKEPHQGKRNDIIAIKQQVASGSTLMKMIENEEIKNYQNIRVAEKLMTYYEKKRNTPPKVYWIYGRSGAGKTKLVYDFVKDNNLSYYTVMDNYKWNDGYDCQDVYIIDDFRENWCPYVYLLRLLDRYECRIEFKGGSRQFNSPYIFITSPEHPKYYYTELNECFTQLERRITKIVNINNYYDKNKILCKCIKWQDIIDEKNAPAHNTLENAKLEVEL